MLFCFKWSWSNDVADMMLVTWYWWQSLRFLPAWSWKLNPKFIFELMVSLLIAFDKFNFWFEIFKWYIWCYQKNLFYQEHLYVIGICGKIVLDNFSLYGNFSPTNVGDNVRILVTRNEPVSIFFVNNFFSNWLNEQFSRCK